MNDLKKIALRELDEEAKEVLNEIYEGCHIEITKGNLGHDISDTLEYLIVCLLENYLEGAK